MPLQVFRNLLFSFQQLNKIPVHIIFFFSNQNVFQLTFRNPIPAAQKKNDMSSLGGPKTTGLWPVNSDLYP